MAEYRTQFDYLLNAVDAAAQQDHPAEHGYAQKRQALFAYVRGLENRAAAPPVGEPAPMPPEMPEIQVGDVLWSGGTLAMIADAAEAQWHNTNGPGGLLKVWGERNGVPFVWRRADRKEA